VPKLNCTYKIYPTLDAGTGNHWNQNGDKWRSVFRHWVQANSGVDTSKSNFGERLHYRSGIIFQHKRFVAA